MTRTRALFVVLSSSFIFSLFVVLPLVGADETKEGKAGLYRPLGLFNEVLHLVKSNYVEPVDEKDLFAGAFSGMTEAMDPFSEYVPPEKVAAFDAAAAAREKHEVLDAGLVLARRSGFPVVVAAIQGSPAAAAGVRTDDVLESVAGESTRRLALWEIEARLSGKPGGRVEVVVVRDAKPRRRTLEIVRASWSPEPPSLSRVDGQAVLRVPTFAAGTAAQLESHLRSLDRTKPLLLDVRGNAFGTFEEATAAAALFTGPGTLAELRGRKIPTRPFKAEAGTWRHEGRVVILVDSGTAAAAELFAAALHESADRARKQSKDPAAVAGASTPARLVGEPTPGMGFSSQVLRLASGGALKISVGKVKTALGRSLSPKGLDPDERVFSVPAGADEKTPTDQILKRGLRLLVDEEPAAPKNAP